jgi:glycosyltransferase involved in cell wall biosynthesis
MNQKNKIKVLFLSAWYPNRYDAMAGLFVRKHAEAVSLYCDVKVLYVHGDRNINNFEIVRHKHVDIEEITVYYPTTGMFLFRYLNYFFAYIKGFKKIMARMDFNVDILHANILTRTVFIAWCYKLFTKTPYVISEHWSRYLPERNGYHGFLRKTITGIVTKSASAILPVSATLKKAMLENGIKHTNFKIIHNVVDDFFYQKQEKKTTTTTTRFLHVSCFDEQAKNIKGILKATKELLNRRTDFELCIIGTGIDYDDVFNYYKSLGFPDKKVLFLGEKSPVEVAAWFASSDCFVLFSNYETAGVVIAESLVCGKPVISTPVGIATEFINDKTGIIVKKDDYSSLTDAMEFFIDNAKTFNPETIREYSSLFSYRTVGNEIAKVYNQILLKS